MSVKITFRKCVKMGKLGMRREDHVLWFVHWFFFAFSCSLLPFWSAFVVYFPHDLCAFCRERKSLINRRSMPNGSSLNWLNARNTVITVAYIYKAMEKKKRNCDTSQYALWKATHFNSHYRRLQNCLNGNLHSAMYRSTKQSLVIW